MTASDQPGGMVADVHALRRSLRDLVALTMLPTVWARYDARQICADLVDVVSRMVDADGVYLSAPSNGCADILRLRDDGDRDLERALYEAPAEGISHGGSSGQRPLRLMASRLSFHASDRFIVAARRAGFPNELERLILQIAVNQASTWLEWKRAEAAVEVEAAFRRAIESSMLAGVAVVDREGRQTYVNRAFMAMVGWDESELTGATAPFVYWPPESIDAHQAALAGALAGEADPSGYELRFLRRDGSRFDVLMLVSPFEPPGQSPGFLASVYDITERKNAARTAQFLAEAGDILNRSLDYEETLGAISTLVVPRFADWCFVDLAEGDGVYRRIAVAHPGRPGDASVAASFPRSYSGRKVLYGLSAAIDEGRTLVMNEVPDQFLDDVASSDSHREALRAIGLRCLVSVPMTRRGTVFGVITFLGTGGRSCFDADDVALAEELARRAALAVDNARLYRNAQEANRAKDEFLANVSHELRTPMTAIIGWAHLLQVGDLERDQVALGLQTIRQSGQAQARLIDDLLDVSRIVTGKLQLNPVAVDLAGILHNAISAIRPAAEAKKQQLEVDIPVGDLTVIGEASRLQQVFWNLLSNAVKFTPPAGVVRLHVTGGTEWVVTVEDNGEGIPSEFLPLVFERFRQAATAARGRTGLGLGLAIARDLVELHGGSIAASSPGPGLGSVFTVRLPRHEGGREEPVERKRKRDRERLHALRVLLVEDDQTTRTLLATVLTNFGAEVTDAASAADAEGVLAHFEPQMLITDIEMPGNDGISLLHLLRARRRALPAIAISGYADDSSRARVAAAGFDGFAAKPIDPDELADQIVRALSIRAGA